MRNIPIINRRSREILSNRNQPEPKDNYTEGPYEEYQIQEDKIEQQPTISPRTTVYRKEELGFGDTRDPTALAKQIEQNPTPHGIGRLLIGGRPIDLHMFEDYMVWKISPYQLRTVLRYRNARVMEEIKNYSSVPVVKLKFGSIMLIIIAIVMGVVGFLVVTSMPQVMEMFKGFL